MNTARHLGDEIELKAGGIIETRAQQVLREAHATLERVNVTGLMESIATGVFADVKRPRDGGRGLDGVFARNPDYFNPIEEALLGATAGVSA